MRLGFEQVSEPEWEPEGKPAEETARGDVEDGTGLPSASYLDPIVGLGNELARQLGLSQTFSSVKWQEGFVRKNRGRYATVQPTTFVPIPSDTPIFQSRSIYLAQNMQARLSTEEWKPLIASALINRWKLRPRKILRILAITIPVIAIYIAGRFVLPPMYPTITNCGPPYTHSYGTCATDNRGWDILVPLGLLLWIPLLVASLISLRPFFNSSIADRETAVRFGKDNLIYSLRRVSEVSPSDNWRVKRRISRLTQPDDATLPHSM